jgi:hypothetical protein
MKWKTFGILTKAISMKHKTINVFGILGTPETEDFHHSNHAQKSTTLLNETEISLNDNYKEAALKSAHGLDYWRRYDRPK